ncbi:EamA family transporter RarD [Motiliproteus sediminis]|uniref:EamA family transporter RarD n=1 Tax=Motiliproteus sediminis TaxID=1468178 RepID=UPI001FEB8B1E|nr:EamA family transporter RarD [Motiliproteus sediminis]
MRNQEQTQGFVLGLAAYGIWGLFPLFFSLLTSIQPTQVLLHRVIWSCLFVALLITLRRGWTKLGPHLRNAKLWRALGASSLLIAANWLIFIYAVGQQKVLATSLGYFMTPLVSAALAVLFLGEHLNRLRLIAIGLALAAIVWQVIQLGALPWIPISLALTFGIYGLVRKQTPIDTLSGLLLETALLLPVALVYWLWLSVQGNSQFLEQMDLTLLMMTSGVVTALPLLAFAAAAKRLSLMAIGFMMYLNPTLQFLTAVMLFEEPFAVDQLISFVCVWTALAVFSYDALRQRGPGA